MWCAGASAAGLGAALVMAAFSTGADAADRAAPAVQPPPTQAPPTQGPAHDHRSIAIPAAVRQEHRAIHDAIEEAARAPGQVGVAGRQLATVLLPHFTREEEIALPPLGLLAPLARGDLPPDAHEVLAMTDALRRELPQMLAEHTRIRAAVKALRVAAEAEHAGRYLALADDLALHAQTEEEVLYPAAVLVGDLIRARSAAK